MAIAEFPLVRMAEVQVQATDDQCLRCQLDQNVEREVASEYRRCVGIKDTDENVDDDVDADGGATEDDQHGIALNDGVVRSPPPEPRQRGRHVQDAHTGRHETAESRAVGHMQLHPGDCPCRITPPEVRPLSGRRLVPEARGHGVALVTPVRLRWSNRSPEGKP